MRLRPFRLVPVLVAVMLLLVPALAAAQDVSDADIALNSTFIFFAAVLVLFMQAGFAMLEVGLSRMKNAGAVMGKILINVSIAFLAFWAVGFSLAFGDRQRLHRARAAGSSTTATRPFDYASLAYSARTSRSPTSSRWSSARCRWRSCSAPCSTAPSSSATSSSRSSSPASSTRSWPTGPGAAAGSLQDGFQDFAGSSIVHLQGALAALAGAICWGRASGSSGTARRCRSPATRCR